MTKSKRQCLAIFLFFSYTMSLGSTALAATVGTGKPVIPGQVNTLIPKNRPALASFKDQKVILRAVGGTVHVKREGTDAWLEAQEDTVMQTHDTIRTGEDGSCRITFDRKSTVYVAANTTLSVLKAIRESGRVKTTVLNLAIGKIKADVNKEEQSSFQIRTPTAVAAVRGTTLYLNVALLAGIEQLLSTDLFLSDGSAAFWPKDNPLGKIIVDYLHGSSIYGDGTVLDSQRLSSEASQEWMELFNGIAGNLGGNPFVEIEEDGRDQNDNRGGRQTALQALIDLLGEDPTGNNRITRINQALLFGLQGVGFLLAEGLPEQGNYQFINVHAGADLGIVNSDRTGLLSKLNNASTLPQAVSALNGLVNLRGNERQQLRQGISNILGFQTVLQRQAFLERTEDTITGKTFTDPQGNRVRVDTYIDRPDSQTVEILALTLRTAGAHAGITSFQFGVNFMNPITGPLRNLAWNDFVNIVEDTELNKKVYSLPKNLQNREQYIVHESFNTQAPLGNYPTDFWAQFTNPAGDQVRMEEVYNSPEEVSFGESSNDQHFAQGLTQRAVIATPHGGQAMTFDGLNGDDVGGAQWGDVTQPGSWGYQGPPGGPNEFDPQYNDFSEGNHPDHVMFVSDGEGPIYGVLGMFIPFTNDGAIVNQNGFELHGIRDFISPNPLVNNGNYNLNTIFQFGAIEGDEEQFSFTPSFEISAIITPEAFNGTPGGPLDTINNSTLFPATLGESEEEYET